MPILRPVPVPFPFQAIESKLGIMRLRSPLIPAKQMITKETAPASTIYGSS